MGFIRGGGGGEGEREGGRKGGKVNGCHGSNIQNRHYPPSPQPPSQPRTHPAPPYPNSNSPIPKSQPRHIYEQKSIQTTTNPNRKKHTKLTPRLLDKLPQKRQIFLIEHRIRGPVLRDHARGEGAGREHVRDGGAGVGWGFGGHGCAVG